MPGHAFILFLFNFPRGEWNLIPLGSKGWPPPKLLDFPNWTVVFVCPECGKAI